MVAQPGKRGSSSQAASKLAPYSPQYSRGWALEIIRPDISRTNTVSAFIQCQIRVGRRWRGKSGNRGSAPASAGDGFSLSTSAGSISASRFEHSSARGVDKQLDGLPPQAATGRFQCKASGDDAQLALARRIADDAELLLEPGQL